MEPQECYAPEVQLEKCPKCESIIHKRSMRLLPDFGMVCKYCYEVFTEKS